MPHPALLKRRTAALGLAATALLAAAWAAGRWLASAPPAPSAAPAMPVIVETVAPRPFADALEALGTAQANESIRVTSRVAQVVTGIHFREGQRVAAGQVLVTLEDSEARANLAAAQAALVESRGQYERARELFRTQAVSASQLEQIEATMRAAEARVHAAEAQLADHTLRAPFAGRVGLRRVSVGALVQPGTEITTLDDTDTIKVDFSVPEPYLATLRPGLPITARSDAFPEREFRGTIASIDSRVDPVTRAIAVRAVLPNREGLLKPGLFMTVRVIREQAEALVVPEQALVPEQNRQYLFVVADGVARKREVQIGRRARGVVEIVAGLAAGEHVVVEGAQKLADGMPVEILERRS
ncbi:MAG TPA: efflux RND transporter periplasmic adaptor subunit [Gammaproteobacteria bacterium]|nr:efflux RND transporter periplasmic adaptor subunit [Gammaproteobacteria bacterium]